MPRAKSPNPLLIQWLKELRDAETKDSNRYMAYNKALGALARHPVAFGHPKECIAVNGIGPKIVKALVEKFVEYKGGEDVDSEASRRKPSASNAKRSSKKSQSGNSTPPDFDSDDDNAPGPSQRNVAGAPFIQTTVLPGGIVVVNRTVPNGGPAAQVALAQERARKNSSTPAAMVALAQRRARAGGLSQEMNIGPPPPPAQPPTSNTLAFFYLDENDNHIQTRDAAAKKIEDELYLYHKIEFLAQYLSHPLVVSGAVISYTKRSDGVIWGWISDTASEAYERCTGYEVPVSQPTRGAERVPARQDSMSNLAAAAALRRLSAVQQNHAVVAEPARPKQEESSSRPVAPSSRPVASSSRPVASSSRVAEVSSQSRTMPTPAPPVFAPDASAAGPSRGKRAAPRLSAQMPVPHLDGSELRINSACIGLDGMDALAQQFPVFSPIVLPSGSYRIVLLVDTREDRRVANDVDRVANALTSQGVACERRTLALGDMLWIAQRVHGKRGDEYDEIVLDFIVERKRMDDLVSSIKDSSRYHDQKFRLHQCALKHVYYVVEGNGKAQRLDRYSEAIATVASSTQVVDGFMVKETPSLKDTIQYLAHLHQAIEESYEGNAIHVIPSQHVRPYSYVALQKHLREVRCPDTPMQVSFDAFRKNNSKQGHVTVDEVWARMLLSINGLGPAKVAAIRAAYKGPAQLRQAFRDAEAIEAAAIHETMGTGHGRGRGKPKIPKAENLLTELGGKGREVIGTALSKRIYRLMRTREYDAAPAVNDEDANDEDE